MPRRPLMPIAANQRAMTGPEETADGARAEALDEEEADDDRRGDRQDRAADRGSRDLDALDRREHGDRRCDHAVAEEERGAEDAECRQCELRPASAGNAAAADEGDQRQDPAL